MNEVTNIILSLVSIILTSVIIPYIRTRTTAEQKKRIKAFIELAVAAAEQIIKGEKKGKERFEYVRDCLQKCKIKLDENELKVMIEAEVYNLNNNNCENKESNDKSK